MNKFLVTLVIVLVAVIAAGYEQVRHANEKWETAMANMKAYDAQLSEEGRKNVAL